VEAAYAHECFVRVYRDTLDRWVGSRPIWNPRAYAVTNVEDNGRIPRTSSTRRQLPAGLTAACAGAGPPPPSVKKTPLRRGREPWS